MHAARNALGLEVLRCVTTDVKVQVLQATERPDHDTGRFLSPRGDHGRISFFLGQISLARGRRLSRFCPRRPLRCGPLPEKGCFRTKGGERAEASEPNLW